ncbi:MAG: hypothetical protein QM534_10960 [Sediminibacterium sp.]|nr:hypothetical protein [Sediminibacterium sp.]
MRSIFCLFVVLLLQSSLHAQDTLFMNNKPIVTKILVITEDSVHYKYFDNLDGPIYKIPTYHVQGITYANGIKEKIVLYLPFRVSEPLEPKLWFDSAYFVKHQYKLYVTDLFSRRLTLGYEYRFSKNWSLDVSAFYQSPAVRKKSPRANISGYFKDAREGSSIALSLQRTLGHVIGKSNGRISIGPQFSFYNDHVSHLTFQVPTNNIPNQSVEIYDLSQKRNGFGKFAKLNFQLNGRYTGIDFFVVAGAYSFFTKTIYNYYSNNPNYFNAYNNYWKPAGISENIKPLSHEEVNSGYTEALHLQVGATILLRQPSAKSFKVIRHYFDSIRFPLKNFVCYIPTELFDGALGFSYGRLIYPYHLSSFNHISTNIIPSSNSASLSNGLLTQFNKHYILSKKLVDMSSSLNFNFSKHQQSFFFMGIMGRTALFEGNYNKQSFLLQKNYLYLNTGVLMRTDNEYHFTCLLNVAAGSYRDNYLSGKPQYVPPQNKNRVRTYPVNAFHFSIQFGYSF